MENRGKLLIPDKNTVLVVIDFQEKLLPAIHDNETVLKEAVKAVQVAETLGIHVIVTEQLPEKIGNTVSGIKDVIDSNGYIIKSSFSCFGEPAFIQKLKSTKAKHLILCGIETHICVLQTGLDALADDYEVYLLTDAVGSRKENDKKIALDRFSHYGGELITVEMMAFEMMKNALHDNFRTVSKLIK